MIGETSASRELVFLLSCMTQKLFFCNALIIIDIIITVNFERKGHDLHECKVISKQRRLSAFFGQQHKEETVETSTANDEAEPENDQSSKPKLKLTKRNFQQSWPEKYNKVRSTKVYVLFALPKIISQINLTPINLFYFSSR